MKKKSTIYLLETFQEPLARGFQNTPYFKESNNFFTFAGCPKLFPKSCLPVFLFATSPTSAPTYPIWLEKVKVATKFVTWTMEKIWGDVAEF